MVGVWLRRLKDVAYDADDVINEFSYETMRRSLRGNNLKYKARDFVSSSNPLAFRVKMAGKIKKINQMLDGITKDMSRFQLQTTPANNTASVLPSESSEQRSRQTASSINESDILGREDDKKRIIDLLTRVIPSSTSSGSRNFEKVSVVSIVGMGGLGKTTLAKLVYNDKLVNKQFELTMWVHVSEDFDVEKLLTKIMESSTLNKFETPLNFAVLVSKVREQLNGKRYLLVLDDIWNNNAEEWERLYVPLLVGAQGSKILITTRKTQVAEVVRGSIPPYKLEKLLDDECWSIIEKKAFSPGGALKTAKMMRIGREIAKKCRGIPLAAKFLGSLMRSRNEEVDWLSIQENDVWNTPESQSKIVPILKLSYDNLSSELKHCFSYCSIFPKNWEIDRVTLVQLWIAEGFLDTCNAGNGRSIEDMADEYFASLVLSSFLDGAQKSLLGDIKTCRMHDLVHDLAQAVAGKQELASLKVSELKNTSQLRRLQLVVDADSSSTTYLKSLSKAKKLRTLFIPEGSNLDPSIFIGNKNLRILHVGGMGPSSNCSLPKLPSLSFKLRHIRYLSLTSVDLRELENDESIDKLYNLETLVLSKVVGVQAQSFLTNIGSLKNIRYLEVSFTDMEELHDSVTSLYNLQTLNLNNCELKVIPDSISGLKNLRFLNLSFNPIEELPVALVTLSNLETLDVNTCSYLKALPVSVAGLTKLRIFDFKNCALLRALPRDFGALTQLRYLNLDGTGVKVLTESCANLSNLEFLDLFICELPRNVIKNWMKLKKLVYTYQGKPIILEGVGKLVCLKELVYPVPAKLTYKLENTVGIEELGNLEFLETLHILSLQNVDDPIDADKANLKRKQNLRGLALLWDRDLLQELMFDRVPVYQSDKHLQVSEALQPPTGLTELVLGNFMGYDLPTWMCVPTGLPDLEYLTLSNCKEIKQIPASIGKLSRLKYLQLQRMSLKSIDIDGFPSLIDLTLTDMWHLEELSYSYSCLRFLSISGCKSLTELPSFPSLMILNLKKVDNRLIRSVGRSLISLINLWLEDIEELICFPISILQNNCNLQELVIVECHQFEGFGVNDVDDGNEKMVTLLSPDLYSGSIQRMQSLIAQFLSFYQIYEDGLLFINYSSSVAHNCGIL